MRSVVSKALSVSTRISSIKQLADTFDKLQAAERRAFGLDEKAEVVENPLTKLLAQLGQRSALPVVANPVDGDEE